MTEICKTREYDKFKLIGGNRDISLSKIKKLRQSISEEDLTNFNPIIVNSKYEIIDGQHRFSALKELDKPIHYIIGDNFKLPQVQRLNAIVSTWGYPDFLASFCKLDKQDYILFRDFNKKFGLRIQECLRLYGANTRTLHHAFKTGTFDFKGEMNVGFTKKVMMYLDIKNHFKKGNTPLIDGFIRLYNNEQYDHIRMIKKINLVSDNKLVLSTCVIDQLRIFEDIYNFNVVEKNHMRFY